MYQAIDKRYLVWLLFSTLGLLTGCTESKPVTVIPPSSTERISLASPAAKKCLKDGYTREVIPDTAGGALCVNQHTGKKCEEWAYFRGECHLNSPN